MSNVSYSRMKSLLENSGLNFSENGITNAEITAYSKGIDMVYKKLIETYYSIFFNLDESNHVDKYIDLLNLSTENLTLSEIKQQIKDRLGERFGQYTIDDFNRELKKVGPGTYYWNEDWGLVFLDFLIGDLERLGRFVMRYTLLHANLGYRGNGLTFEQWDKYAQTFYKYDSINLPFDILDSLGSEMIE